MSARVTAERGLMEYALPSAARITAERALMEYDPGRTTLTKTTALGAYGNYGVAHAADVTMQRPDLLNGNQIIATGRDLVLAYNLGSAAHSIAIDSSKDPYQRYEDINYQVGVGELAIFGPFEVDGWANAFRILVDCDHWDLWLGVVALPG